MQAEIPLDLEPAKRFTKLPGAIWNAIYGGPKGKKQDVFCNSSQSDQFNLVYLSECSVHSIASRSPFGLRTSEAVHQIAGSNLERHSWRPEGQKKQNVFCNSSQSDVEQFVLVDEAINSISSWFSKITSRFKKLEGYKTGLHSFRGHFATALEEIGCPEQLATQLAGHKRLSLTYNLYSKYQNKEEMWSYIERIHETDTLCLGI
ncbi:hypothetical protein J1N51_13670 [Psychrosphaera ytuae]|uniref:Uncharacterized protein n=1 Tax=Psychrosphaera ytuae TaxID=2820710 RepID=A0A975DBK0_9GAMM|nr:hypothetical protein [Psychrosphaera ytuae]QTH63744.1 hypothetical protein J1N51_13670 [Psychrosphaera ytuae]